jgi:hypothetical protein
MREDRTSIREQGGQCVTMRDVRRTVKTHMFEAGDKTYRGLLLANYGLLLGPEVGNAETLLLSEDYGAVRRYRA